MWSSSLFWKLFFIYVGLNLTLAIAFLFAATSFQRGEINRQVEQRLLDTAIVLRSHVGELVEQTLADKDVYAAENPDGDVSSETAEIISEKQQELQRLIGQLSKETKLRTTVIDDNGIVLAESERNPARMLDHSNRPELIEAQKAGRGTAVRKSPTLGIDMFYLALAIKKTGESQLSPPSRQAYIRVAMRLDLIDQRVTAMRRFLWLLALVFGSIATLLAYAMVGRVINPLTQLTQRAQSLAMGVDQDTAGIMASGEVSSLSASLDQMQSELAKRFGQLRENNERMSTVLGSVQEGIIAVDANENIVLANDASKRLLSFTTDDEVGRPLLEAVRSRRLRDVIQQCMQKSETVQTELQSVGEMRRDLAITATQLPGDPVPGVVLVLHDVTELRRWENLRQEFVANVSHELKTPLASIKAYAETLRLGAIHDPENNERFVLRIEDQAERLNQLILDMLQIARVESGEKAFEITSVSIAKVVDACVHEFQRAASRKNIDLVVKPAEDGETIVQAEEDGLRTILDNLVGNAIKYTPERGTVTVQWRQQGSTASLEVQDTGIGIPEDHWTRVFERFYRVDKARSRELGGTGLGLSIVKHLCQAFGGSVDLTNTRGGGSTFRVNLPAKQQ
ncbi:sensor histidine kinase [Planctomycetes bacterium K23_9]|uniref:histidine kinase n=1 Tax=Stieleria marina TaxID=1930275 RepID=A0A517NN77_9BACT|nr:Sensor histidine kinase YycG [Planctomycetes bacterium K23_9]